MVSWIEFTIQEEKWSRLTPHVPKDFPSAEKQRKAALDTSLRFFGLWTAQVIRLGPPQTSHPHAWMYDASVAIRLAEAGARIVQQLPQGTSVNQLWDGRTNAWEGLPITALLEDSTRQALGDSEGQYTYHLECRLAIVTFLRRVARQLVMVDDPPGPLVTDRKFTKKCAAIWIAYNTVGLDNLTKWQLVMLSVYAEDVSVLLNQYGRLNDVPQDSPMQSSQPHPYVILPPRHSLGHQHVPSLTARQAQRSAVSQGVLRERWA